MLYKRKKSENARRFKKIIILLSAVLIISVILFEMQAVPFTKKCVNKQAKTISTNIIAETVRDVSEEFDIKYTDFAMLHYSQSDELKSISEDTVFVNKFKAEITTRIQNELDRERLYKFALPLGAFTDITLLSTLGPPVEISFVLTGSVNCRLKSRFESAGVNQTIHHIYIVVNTEIITISPEYSEQVDFKTEYEIAQTVIVGSVPSTFADIVR